MKSAFCDTGAVDTIPRQEMICDDKQIPGSDSQAVRGGRERDDALISQVPG